MKNIYINGIGNISPQATFTPTLDSEIATSQNAFLDCQEPDYKDFIQSKLLRRMSRSVKMGLTTSQKALDEAGNPSIDAIITGTAWGCVEDTEKFLETVLENKEEYLTPTAFVQSTHNTVAGQIALMHHNNCYNMTYVQSALSFESALMDALLQFYDGKAQNILVGGIDEQTDKLKILLERLHCATPSHPMGEGAAFFVLSNQQQENSYAKLVAATTFYRPKNNEILKASLVASLKNAGLKLEDIDFVFTGNQDTTLEKSFFANATIQPYKQFCGEYPTSTAFAMAVGADLLKGHNVLNLNSKGVKNIVIYNQYQGTNHAFVVLSVI